MIERIAVWFNQGGTFMWILLFVAAAALAVAFERYIYYFIVCRRNGDRIIDKLTDAISSGNNDATKGIVARGTAPLNALLRTAINRFISGARPETVQESVAHAAIKEVPKLSKRLNYLALIANIATLLGLLGTIAGLQVSFSSLASVDAAQKAAMLAKGISAAMNTTAFGLIIAVPCMALYTMLNNRQQELVKDIDDSIVRLLAVMKEKVA
jgi:biopolymer transport protein ExbB